MEWIDRAARRAAERHTLTRRQALKGFAAGALLAGPGSSLLTSAARGASCLRTDPSCTSAAESAFAAELRACPRDTTWAELRCRVRAQHALTAARAQCRTPDHSRCPEGQRCDGTTGSCVAGDPGPAPEPGTGPVGTGPCANDWPTEASLVAARAALAGGAPVVDLSPGGCVRMERAGDTERMTVAGAVVSELARTATGTSGRRDDDRDGFFESEFEIRADRAEFVRRDPQTRAVVRRETRTVEPDAVLVVIEEHGEVVQQFRSPTGDDAPAGARTAAATLTSAEFCGPELDAHYGRLMMKAVHRVSKCLEERGLGDVANELVYAGTHATLLCDDLWSAYARAVDAGGGARSGRIVLDPEAMDTELENDQIQTLAHELLHYTSLGLHDGAHTSNEDSRMEEGDRVYACAILCADGATSAPNKCHCATCLQTGVCDERCKRELECKNPDLGAICPCLARNKWYPTFEECAVDCSSGLLCFGFSKCKSLSRKC